MMMEIDAKAFTVMELMEMDSLLRIPPPDTFRRLGFGRFSWLGVSGLSMCILGISCFLHGFWLI